MDKVQKNLVEVITNNCVTTLTSEQNKNKLGEFKKIGSSDLAYRLQVQNFQAIFSEEKDNEKREKLVYDACSILINKLEANKVWKNRSRKTFKSKDEINRLFNTFFKVECEKRDLVIKLDIDNQYICTDPDTNEEWLLNAINWKNLSTADKIEEKQNKQVMKVIKS